MRLLTLSYLIILPLVDAFTPTLQKTPFSTEVNLQRRDVLVSGIAAVLTIPGAATAKPASTFFYDEKIEFVKEESQMPTNGKFDLNSAFVGDYKVLPGMFPHAAGKIASNGPYNAVKDIYKIDGLTDNDKKLFKQYESAFTVNPPGRTFNERINSRVST